MTAQLRLCDRIALLNTLCDHLERIVKTETTQIADEELRNAICPSKQNLHDALATLPIDSDTNDAILIVFHDLCKTFYIFSLELIDLSLLHCEYDECCSPGIWNTTAAYRLCLSEGAWKLTDKLRAVIRSIELPAEDGNPP
eukprot:2641912-Rhodomonas_salina.2